jgi:hypothetical protein
LDIMYHVLNVLLDFDYNSLFDKIIV